MASAARQFSNCLSHVQAEPTLSESIVRAVSGMSLADTLRLIGRLVDHDKFADCDYWLTQRLDDTLAGLLERTDNGEYENTAADWREIAADRAAYQASVL